MALPLHKIVISKWLLELGKELGCKDLAYIPNAVNREKYRIGNPIEHRQGQVAMLFHAAKIKGAADGIEAVRIVREKYPHLRFVMFGTVVASLGSRSGPEYYRNPPQGFIVDEI